MLACPRSRNARKIFCSVHYVLNTQHTWPRTVFGPLPPLSEQVLYMDAAAPAIRLHNQHLLHPMHGRGLLWDPAHEEYIEKTTQRWTMSNKSNKTLGHRCVRGAHGQLARTVAVGFMRWPNKDNIFCDGMWRKSWLVELLRTGWHTDAARQSLWSQQRTSKIKKETKLVWKETWYVTRDAGFDHFWSYTSIICSYGR